MIKKLQKKYALSEQGAKDLIKGCLACVLQNLSFMFPVGLLYYLVSDLMNGGVPGGKIPFYVAGCVVCIGLILLTTFFQYNATYFATYKESGIRRITLAEHLRKIPLSFFGKKDLADLTSTIMADCTFLEQSFSHFIPELAGSIISTILISIGLLFTDWRMALAALWVLPVAFAIVGFSAKIQENLNQKAMDVKMACADGIQECIETVRDLKANNAEQAYLKGLEKKIRAVEHRSILNEFGLAVFVVSASLVLKLGIATVALVGVVLLMQGSLSVLTFFMFLLVVSRLYDPLQGALQNLAAVISTRTNIARMNEILDHPIQQGSDRLSNQGYDIVFDHVSFSYAGEGGNLSLKDVNLHIKSGQTVGIIGGTGSAKSTLVQLIPRLYDVTKGSVMVSGVDVRKYNLEALRDQVSMVLQKNVLFSGTIYDNIRWGNENASDEEVQNVCKLAQADGFVREFPDGYNTQIVQGGNNVSGGQKQRLCIARALLKKPKILILDDSTSAVDTKTDALIRKAFREEIPNTTKIIIAQRVSSIEDADQIIVLENGAISGIGTSEELLKTNDIYREVYESQVKGGEDHE